MISNLTGLHFVILIGFLVVPLVVVAAVVVLIVVLVRRRPPAPALPPGDGSPTVLRQPGDPR